MIIFRYLFVSLFVFASSAAGDIGAKRDYLDQYVGRWVGEYSVYSPATDFRKDFILEQRYWWEGDVLHGLSVSEANNESNTAQSKTFMFDGNLRTEVQRGDQIEAFWGVINDTELVWITADLERASDYQITEKFLIEDGQIYLTTAGFDTFNFQGKSAYLLYKSRLRKIPESVVE